MTEKIKRYKDLKVFIESFDAAMEIFEITKYFAVEEKYGLTTQIRRSSRSVSANIAEAWRKRKYPKSFISKLSDCEAEAAETQVWLDFSESCKYIDKDKKDLLYQRYDYILSMLVKMMQHPEKWTISKVGNK